MRGVVYVAYGERARAAAARSIKSLKGQHPDMRVVVIGEQVGDIPRIPFKTTDLYGRWAKCHVDTLSPFNPTLYLDADTLVQQDISAGFRIIEDGWDFVTIASKNQEDQWLSHIGTEERNTTRRELGAMMLQLGGGVFWFCKNTRVARFFQCWREEWKRWRDQDQGALIRALQRAPMKLWLFGKPWNGRDVIRHEWGTARRRDR